MADSVLFQATSAAIDQDGSTFVVLRWENVGDAVGYNILRRRVGESERPRRINGRNPVRVPLSSRELGAIVAPGTGAWDTLANLLAAAAGSPGGTISPVDPAEAFDRGLTDAERSLIRAAAQASLTLGRIAGVAYIDRHVSANEQYRYELHGVRADASTFVLAQDLVVQAGAFTLPAPPSGVSTQAGDRRVLVLWNRNPQAATFDVERGLSPGGPFARVNPLPIAYDLATNLDGTAARDRATGIPRRRCVGRRRPADRAPGRRHGDLRPGHRHPVLVPRGVARLTGTAGSVVRGCRRDPRAHGSPDGP